MLEGRSRQRICGLFPRGVFRVESIAVGSDDRLVVKPIDSEAQEDRCRRESGWNSGDAISERMKLPPHAGRSIG
jgi:hypothetical protein